MLQSCKLVQVRWSRETNVSYVGPGLVRFGWVGLRFVVSVEGVAAEYAVVFVLKEGKGDPGRATKDVPMLIEFPCPKCGGPALTLDGEVSCPLCGNQPAPPEADKKVEEALGQPDSPDPPQSVHVPNVIEFMIGKELSGKEEWSEKTLSFAVEYLLGYMEAYGSWPDTPFEEGEERVYFSPSPGQADAIAELCSRYSVEPVTVVKMAVTLYVLRER